MMNFSLFFTCQSPVIACGFCTFKENCTLLLPCTDVCILVIGARAINCFSWIHNCNLSLSSSVILSCKTTFVIHSLKVAVSDVLVLKVDFPSFSNISQVHDCMSVSLPIRSFSKLKLSKLVYQLNFFLWNSKGFHRDAVSVFALP